MNESLEHEKRLIRLPDAETIMQKLVSAVDDNYLKERLYPIIAKEAGRELRPNGVVLMVQLAFAEYVKIYRIDRVTAYLQNKHIQKLVLVLIDDEDLKIAAQAR